MNMMLLIVALNISAEPQAARIDNPDVRAKFERHRQVVKVEAPPAQRTIVADTQATNILMLEAVLDRAVLVYFEIPPGNEAMLEGTGAVHVHRAEDIAHNTIWAGRYYRLLHLAESAPDDESLQKFCGMPMKFDVAMRSDGKQVVLDVRRP